MSSTSSPQLVISSIDVTDTTIDCDALGLHYQISTSKIPGGGFLSRKRLVTFTKSWDPHPETQNATIAEWETNGTMSDLISLSGKDFKALSSVFPLHNASV